ncbi:MAG TPA: tannase/feruloyl esterase family alpha/beta hydrolase, partial [Caulobacteraceae bacterium]|nr:tannase/feruloyl esterase family alpha/beta hydrolase [Caulobacteraceae bacterium]
LAYYSAMTGKLGPASRNTRLFMMPGMGHCFEGNGPQFADFLGEMDRWQATGVAPERIVAEKPVNYLLALAGVKAEPLMTRPICAWPKVAHYTGKGSLDRAANFTCQAAGASGARH